MDLVFKFLVVKLLFFGQLKSITPLVENLHSVSYLSDTSLAEYPLFFAKVNV